jgi:hypothetical protein
VKAGKYGAGGDFPYRAKGARIMIGTVQPKKQRDHRLRGDDGLENGYGVYGVATPLWLTPLPSDDKGVPIHRLACPAILPARISGKPAGA